MAKPASKMVRGSRVDGLTPDLIEKLEQIQQVLGLSSLRATLRYVVRVCPMPKPETDTK